MSLLQKLREKQKAQGLVAPSERPDVETPIDPATVRRPVPPPRPIASAEADGLALDGHLRLLPPSAGSVLELSADWRKEFWSGPSPWCRVNGQPDHPEFAKNLASRQ